jgi:hypothetical protein
MLRRQRVSLNDYRGSWLPVVARRCHGNDVASPHFESNSETASIQHIASRSARGSNLATCLAIRRRTTWERASGTINRSSRRPCARRRSRIALIRSDASAIYHLTVTRYSVTRYVTQIKAAPTTVALDMESSAVAANGFRIRVPYGSSTSAQLRNSDTLFDKAFSLVS